MKRHGRGGFPWGLCLLLALSGPSWAGRLYYSFRSEEGGGLASLKVDEASGAIVAHERLFVDARLTMAKKLRFDADGERLAVTSEGEEAPFMFITKVSGDEPLEGRIDAMADELRPWAQFWVSTCGDGRVSLVKSRSGKIHRSWNGRASLSPPGHRPEDVILLPDGLSALVSFQKDGKKGREGNRIVLLDLPRMTCTADLRLPRDHPELHVADDPKMAGPGPEVLLASKEANCILVTLDLYGAVAMFDLDGARKGKRVNWQVLPTSPDGSWGTAFPDRAVLLPVAKGRFALVANAGGCGGLLLFDLASRSLLRRWDVGSGLEAPVWLEGLEAAVSVRSGKHKRRMGDVIEKDYRPGKDLWVFPVGRARQSAEARSRRFDLGVKTFLVEAVDPQGCDLLVVFGGEDGADELLVVDPIDGRVLDRQPCLGRAQRVLRP